MDKPKIIIAEDEEIVRIKFRDFLNHHLECEIRESSNGRQTLDILRKEPIDLVLLDIGMAGISGLGVLKQAKEEQIDTPMLVISGWDSPQIVEEALQNGAIDYIPKPSTMDVIYAKICEVLKKKNKYIPKTTAG